MALVKCAIPGCAAQARAAGINPSYCAAHLTAHYSVGGLNAAWWAEQMEKDRTAWREATGPDGRIDLVLASLRSSIAARENGAEPIDLNWFAAMTTAALDAIEVAPMGATVTLSAALFETLCVSPALYRWSNCFPRRVNGPRIVVNRDAMDSRLAYDDFSGERIVVIYPPISGLR